MSLTDKGVALLEQLRRQIESKDAIVGVIGLGYVGLPVAATFAGAGFSVIGVDIKPERVRQINKGQNPIGGQEPGLAELLATAVSSGRLRATDDYRELSAADVVLIDVETPVDESHRPRYLALRSACEALAGVMKKGALVVVESTVAPGTIDRVVRPLLEKYSGRKSADEFFVGACPERVMPGKLLRNLRTMSRVCGGETPEVAQLMVTFYRHIVEAELDSADPVTAEVVKTTENAYRDVQIAFANEVALICEAVGADIWQVRDLVNKVPYRHMHLPGAGVGGHCIPKDPWLLASAAGEAMPARLIPEARAVNDGMPHHVAQLTLEALRARGLGATEARVAVLGYAYLENSDDDRNSPSQSLVRRLKEEGLSVAIHDPWIEAYQGDLQDIIAGRDGVVIMVAHKEYLNLDLQELGRAFRTPLVVDGRHVLDKEQVEAAGLAYRGIGIGQ
ncbi:MAG: nucleotide sugar dehydrogenase [Chloroflexota bacterium]|nr:MAG: nucleotide sugar dehydrogenase [Chloroflexota bacterium]